MMMRSVPLSWEYLLTNVFVIPEIFEKNDAEFSK